MNPSMIETQTEERINAALWDGAMTRRVRIGRGTLKTVGDCIHQFFQPGPIALIADPNTYAAAGRDAYNMLRAAGQQVLDPYIFEDDDLYADYRFVERLQSFLSGPDTIPVAVGSGTINDLTKLASHLCGRPYMVVGTAGSMDGYASFGASITRNGFKQTMSCPAPVAIVMDLDVIAAAPVAMNAAGYADLLAKVPGGADWMLAEMAGTDTIHAAAWDLVQSHLRTWTSDPDGIRRRDQTALAGLVEGLIMTGLGMQRANSSRPASGAEHLFSHLWDMQHHTYLDATPMHGFKVAIGTMASAAMYEWVLGQDAASIHADPTSVDNRWPSWDRIEQWVRTEFPDPFIAEKVLKKSRHKYLASTEVAKRLAHLKNHWSDFCTQLNRQLLSAKQLQTMLASAGAPHTPEDIGISRARLRTNFDQAQKIRSRYTILDLVFEAGWWDACLDDLFKPGGFFGC